MYSLPDVILIPYFYLSSKLLMISSPLAVPKYIVTLSTSADLNETLKTELNVPCYSTACSLKSVVLYLEFFLSSSISLLKSPLIQLIS